MQPHQRETMNPIKKYLSTFLGLGLLITAITCTVWIMSLQKDVLEAKNEKHVCSLEKQGFESALYIQSEEILEQAAEHKQSQNQLRIWKEKPPSIKYKILYKSLPKDTNLTRGNCNDTKNILNTIRNIDYSDI